MGTCRMRGCALEVRTQVLDHAVDGVAVEQQEGVVVADAIQAAQDVLLHAHGQNMSHPTSQTGPFHPHARSSPALNCWGTLITLVVQDRPTPAVLAKGHWLTKRYCTCLSPEHPLQPCISAKEEVCLYTRCQRMQFLRFPTAPLAPQA